MFENVTCMNVPNDDQVTFCTSNSHFNGPASQSSFCSLLGAQYQGAYFLQLKHFCGILCLYFYKYINIFHCEYVRRDWRKTRSSPCHIFPDTVFGINLQTTELIHRLKVFTRKSLNKGKSLVRDILDKQRKQRRKKNLQLQTLSVPPTSRRT